jgi:hypothetical protein
MTLPDERYRSLVQTKNFLLDLLNTQKTPRVPKIIRQRAHSLLRHWPDNYHLELMTEEMPKHFAKQMEPLYRMVKQHDMEKKDETGT